MARSDDRWWAHNGIFGRVGGVGGVAGVGRRRTGWRKVTMHGGGGIW